MMSMKYGTADAASEFAYNFDSDNSFDLGKVRMFTQSPRAASRPGLTIKGSAPKKTLG